MISTFRWLMAFRGRSKLFEKMLIFMSIVWLAVAAANDLEAKASGGKGLELSEDCREILRDFEHKWFNQPVFSILFYFG